MVIKMEILVKTLCNTRIRYLAFLAGAIVISRQTALADLVTFTGNLTSDGAAVGSGAPFTPNPATISAGDAFSILLTYDPASFMHSGNSYVLTDASAKLTFDGYSFGYTSASGNYIELSTPGVFGSNTTSFLICSSLTACSSGTGDFIDLYFKGTVTNPSTLQAQASGLSGDLRASPSEFEFLRNFSDGSQTDLQGTVGVPTAASPVPEPSSRALLGFVLPAMAVIFLHQ